MEWGAATVCEFGWLLRRGKRGVGERRRHAEFFAPRRNVPAPFRPRRLRDHLPRHPRRLPQGRLVDEAARWPALPLFLAARNAGLDIFLLVQPTSSSSPPAPTRPPVTPTLPAPPPTPSPSTSKRVHYSFSHQNKLKNPKRGRPGGHANWFDSRRP